jgi:YD repeat-containing protein
MTVQMSDREKHGLRGPVKTWVVETTFGPRTASDGEQIPECKSRHTAEYGVDGRTLATRFGNPDGSEWVTLHAYDIAGNLLKTTSGNGGETTTQTYSYDDHGRLLSVANSRKPDSPVTFRYDEQGRKTKVQTSRPEDYMGNVAEGGTPFQATDRAPNLPGGGSATTVYDEHERPTEVQVRDARGEVVKRAAAPMTRRDGSPQNARSWTTRRRSFRPRPGTKF